METVRSKIIRCLLEKREHFTRSQLVDVTGEKPNSIRGSLVSLLNNGVIDKAKEKGKATEYYIKELEKLDWRTVEIVLSSIFGSESKETRSLTPAYISMKEATNIDFKKFYETHSEVEIESVKVKFHEKWDLRKFAPIDYTPETTTVWSFPDRGDWATHIGNYRGNWSPFIPRNLILRYTQKDDLILDQMVGSGTTVVECKLLQRNVIAVDINPDAIMVTRDRLNFIYNPLDEEYKEPEIKTYIGDARNLNLIEKESVDLIATHPPYASIIPYSKKRVEGDLSSVHDIAEFAGEMRKVAEESFRVLKPGKHCAILIGDTRRHKHFVPITPRVLQSFLDVGFILREDIIKLQWKMKSTREKWRGKNYDFYLIGHEHLYVFRKPEKDEKLSPFKESLKWW